MTPELSARRWAAQLCPRPTKFAVLAAVMALGACEYPTSLPIFETEWVVPAEETRFGVAELLPGEVTLEPDLSAFIVDFDPVSFSTSLGAICAACAAADGFTVPKPAFVGDVESDIDFPAEVSAVTILDGSIYVEVTNGLNFDPIRPQAGSFGSIEIEITDSADGDVVGTLVIDGTDTAFPETSTLARSVPLQAAVVDGGLHARVRIDSPTGDPVTVDSSLPISVLATALDVRVESVDIDVGGRSVTLDPTSLDLEDIDEDIADRVISGAFLVDVTNPFGVGADFQITISGPGFATINKSVTVPSDPQVQVRIDFTVSEIRSMLGSAGLTLSGGATVDAGAGVITVNPGEELVFTASLDLALRVGG